LAGEVKEVKDIKEVNSTNLEPAIESLQLGGKLTGSFDEIAKRLSSLQMFSMRSTLSEMTLVKVESRDMQRRPYLFMIFAFTKDGIKIEFSIGFDSGAKLRRLYVLKNLAAVLSLIADLYEVDNTELLQHLDSSIDDFLGSLTPEYGSLYNSYQALLTKHRELRRLKIDLANSNKNLSVQASMLENENSEIKSRLKELETYSDESLMSMIQDWIDAHGGSIDVTAFATTHRITPPRVEQILDLMVREGYIELKG
jgi:hypothetical protein